MIVPLFQRIVFSRRWLTFATMCVAFGIFGLGAAHLFNLYRGSFGGILYGGMAAAANIPARQFVDLVATLVVSMAAWLVFRACERRLVSGPVDIGPDGPQR